MFEGWPPAIVRFAVRLTERSAWFASFVNGRAINSVMGFTRNRPHPWSTLHDYVSWDSLTDRRYLGRHLAPKKPARPLPDETLVEKLFERPAAKQRLSDKSTCLFPAFAQYLTDGFIRTDQGNDADPKLKRRLTTSNHEIDLCPLYGVKRAQTDELRLKSEAAGEKGRLKFQMRGAEMYAPFLFGDDGLPKPEFTEVSPPLEWERMSAEQKRTIFAFGGDRANTSPFVAMMNTLLLREHNRLAGELERRNPAWDDERVFQTARNILIPIFITIVVEEYINHITPLPIRLMAKAEVAWRAIWNRTNWITVEFSLLYRWHSLMPDAIDWPTGPIPLGAFFTSGNGPLIEIGLAEAFVAASAQKAGEIGAFNTSPALIAMGIERKAIDQGRVLDVPSYNDYRDHFGVKRAEKFSDISSDPKVCRLLAEIYAAPDDVEFYPGLFSEDLAKNSVLPGLLMRMVAVDAFSQALTNPLMSEHVLNAETFTAWGLEQIEQTRTIADLVKRNSPVAPSGPIRMTQDSWLYAW